VDRLAHAVGAARVVDDGEGDGVDAVGQVGVAGILHAGHGAVAEVPVPGGDAVDGEGLFGESGGLAHDGAGGVGAEGRDERVVVGAEVEARLHAVAPDAAGGGRFAGDEEVHELILHAAFLHGGRVRVIAGQVDDEDRLPGCP
jgi:hypothetical protein